MNRFIRIGSKHINLDKIVEIDTNHETVDFRRTVHIVLVSQEIDGAYGTNALASFSVAIDYAHDTPEAQAVIAWLSSQSEILL